MIEDLVVQEAQFFEDMVVGSNPEMRNVLYTISKLSKTEVNVLIVGDSGTGKELVAKAIHKNSPRNKRPFVSVDLSAHKPYLLEAELFGYIKGAVPEALIDKKGLIEAADKGTLFINNIDQAEFEIQGKILRTVELNELRPVGANKTHKVNVRIICSTSHNLETMVTNKTFRQDLYYRLSLVTIMIPPLRKRKEDIPLLAKYFMDRNNKKLNKNVTKITNRAMGRLLAYPYPGNIRELDHIITQALLNAKGSAILEELLPEKVRQHQEQPVEQTQDLYCNEIDLTRGYKELRNEFLHAFEKHVINQYFKLADGNITKAAELAGIDRATFHRILKRLKLSR